MHISDKCTIDLAVKQQLPILKTGGVFHTIRVPYILILKILSSTAGIFFMNFQK